MRAEELTIGDWFSFNGEVGQIGIIDNWDGEVSYFNGDAEGILTFGFDDIEPIQLTDEILKKNGFTKIKSEENVYHRHFDNGYISVYNTLNNGFRISLLVHRYEEVKWCRVDFVHELQHEFKNRKLFDLANNFKV